MISSLSTSSDNIYSIMNNKGAAMGNVDSQKAMSIGGDLQRGIQEVQSARDKGSTETHKQTLYKLNVLV